MLFEFLADVFLLSRNDVRRPKGIENRWPKGKAKPIRETKAASKSHTPFRAYWVISLSTGRKNPRNLHRMIIGKHCKSLRNLPICVWRKQKILQKSGKICKIHEEKHKIDVKENEKRGEMRGFATPKQGMRGQKQGMRG